MKPSVAPGFYSKPHVGEIDLRVHELAEERSSFDVRDWSPPLSADGGALKIQRIVRLERETGITR